MTIRITWQDLLRAGACPEGLPAFQRAVKEHSSDPDALVLPDWKAEHVSKCLKLPGGRWWLHFLEKHDFVPIVESAEKRFPRALSGQRKSLLDRVAKRIKAEKAKEA